MKGKVGELWNTVFVGILRSMLNGFLPFFFKKGGKITRHRQ